MKNKNIKQEKGITLIALVITIIVLLILAGVAISMLSGENGILTRAAEAKEDTEEAQKKENVSLIDMEVQIDFSTATKNIPYKFKNGYLTNISVTNGEIETVEAVESKLPDEYTVCDAGGNSINDKGSTKAGTGMTIKKDEKKIGRIIVFGDINGDGMLNASDFNDLANIIVNPRENFEEYQIIASDIENDGYINREDSSILTRYISKIDPTALDNQNFYPQEIKEMSIISNIEFIKKLGITDQKDFESFEDGGVTCYEITLNNEYTYKQLGDKIMNNKNVKSIKFYDSEGKKVLNSSTDKIMQGNRVGIVLQDIEKNLICESTEMELFFN